MIVEIKKRDGRVEPFDRHKIVNAIMKAMAEVGSEDMGFAYRVAGDIEKMNPPGPLSVEEIQDIVEKSMMASPYKDAAREYIRYRYKREASRSFSNDFVAALSEKIEAKNVQNQNANVDEKSFGGRVGEAANLVMERYALDYIVSDMARKNHENNEIYIHDLNSYAVGNHNCLSVPFDDLLAKGFNTKQADVRPAQSVSTAFQLVAVIFQLQSLQQFGGVSATHIDHTMVPYVRKSFRKHYIDGMRYMGPHDDLPKDHELDEFFAICHDDMSIEDEYYKAVSDVYSYAMTMTKREVYQAVEGMYHNLNTLQSRSGNQLPFTSINYGTCTLPEGRMVTKALLDVSIAGVGKLHKTSIFPCGIFQCMKGVNRLPGEPNYDLFRLALKSTARRLYPNYANVDWSGNAGYDINDPKTYFSTMGCRTANGMDINGFDQLKDGRGNICPVTIILPTIAMEANRDVEKFMELLDTKIHEAKDMLIERFEYIASQPPESAKFMYENGLMAGYVPKEGIRSALKHGTLALGQLGLAETLQLLIGCDHTTDKGMELAKRIEHLFKDRCAQFKQQYKLNIGVYYTPAENLCYKALKKFREKYGVIENVSDRDYFTNSMHCPVWADVGVFEKIDIESQLTGYSNAGCITYVELDSTSKNNIDAMETIVNYAMDHDIPYFAINVPNDTCLDCGYCDEFNDRCPICGSTNIMQLRRVTGYLSLDYRNFNPGKQKEVLDRVKHGKLINFVEGDVN